MITLGMNEEMQQERMERVAGKLKWLSRMLGEMDEWLESRRGPSRLAEGRSKVVTLENIDLHAAREKP